jgi:hypothetical protein
MNTNITVINVFIAKTRSLVLSTIHFWVFAIVLITATFIRLWAAPLSAGPDVAQFWAFAEIFHLRGLDFYRYASANLTIFPMKGWGFVYPPIWLLILGLALLFAPSSLANNVMVDTDWRITMKAPIIIADLAIGILIYWAVPGSKWRKLAFASLWLFHPTAWFESAVFGQFDAIAAALLLASVIMIIKGKDRLAFLLAALAMMTKQHAFFAIAMIVFICLRNMDRHRLITNCAISVGVVAALSIPFLLTGNLLSYARALFLPGSKPGYQNPLFFSFSGSGALLTHLHNLFGWDTARLIPFTIPVMVVAMIVTAIFFYRRFITPLQGALAGLLLFVGLFYRVNYQYLIMYIPLAILLAATTKYQSEKVFAIVLAMFPGIWIWLANIPWWFHNFEPHYYQATPILARIGLLDRYFPDYAYVSFAFVLMCVSIAYVVLMFLKWSRPLAK